MGRMSAKEKIQRTPIDESEFIKAWARVHREGGNVQDVAELLGCSYAGARNKSEKLIEAGIPLPELKKYRKRKEIDVAGLKAELKSELSKK
jgi:hypothetical protein